MEQKFEFSGKSAVIVGLILIVGIGIRVATFSDSTDTELEKKVRAELWSSYSGHHLGPEIREIDRTGDYDKVADLLKRSSPDAITIERISRSEPLLSWSSNQEVIVRVYYRFPGETETRTKYMKFKHGAIGGWSYQYDSSSIAYYLNFF